MKKILFTLHWYPSNRSANGLCDEKIINELLQTNQWEIHCLCYSNNSKKSSEYINGCYVHRIPLGIKDQLVELARSSKNKYTSFFYMFLSRLLLRFLQIILMPFHPIINPLTYNRFAKEARRLHQKEKFDVVVSECFGIETLHAGYSVKKNNPDVVFIAIYWDALCGGINPKFQPNWYSNWLRKKYELNINNKADGIIYMKSNKKNIEALFHKEEFYSRISYLNLPSLHLNTKKTDTVCNILNPNYINIVFVGSLSGRPIEFLLEVFHKAKISNIRLNFVVSKEYQAYIKKISYKYELDIYVHDYMSYEKVQSLCSKADFLLNIGNKNPNVVPSKLFDYISYGLPIISTAPIDNEPCIPYLNKYPSALVLYESSTMEREANKLIDFISNYRGKKVDTNIIATTYSDNLPEKYMQVINKICNEK